MAIRRGMVARLTAIGAVVGTAVGIAGAPLVAVAQSQPPAETPKRQPRQPRQPSTPPGNPQTPPAQDPVPTKTPNPTPAPANPAPGPQNPAPTSTPNPAPNTAPSNTNKNPGTPVPGTGAKAAPIKEPREPGPYVVRQRPKDYNVKINVDVASSSSLDTRRQLKGNQPLNIPAFDFRTLTMVFPLPPQTSGGVPNDGSLTGKLTIDDQVVSEKATLLGKQLAGTQYHSGVRLIRMNSDTPSQCRQIGMEIAYRTTCFVTEVNEAEAVKVDWPKGEWPSAAKSTFEPQMFVDYCIVQQGDGVITENYDPRPIQDWVNNLTKGNPRAVPPYTVAKYLASEVVAKVQSSGDGLAFLSTGQFQGFNLQGPTVTFQQGRGSDQDIPPLLVAVYRAAGLPARLVIGYEASADAGSNSMKEQLGMKRGRKAFRSWVEFCLYDEANNTVNWVPVDVVELRKKSSRTGPLDKPWEYFGSHKDLNEVVPIALGFHPPTTVESYGAPAMWGWMMTPTAPPAAFQAIRIDISSASKSGVKPGEKKDDDKDDKKDKVRGK